MAFGSAESFAVATVWPPEDSFQAALAASPAELAQALVDGGQPQLLHSADAPELAKFLGAVFAPKAENWPTGTRGMIPERNTTGLLAVAAEVADRFWDYELTLLEDADPGYPSERELQRVRGLEPRGVAPWIVDATELPNGGESIDAMVGLIGTLTSPRHADRPTEYNEVSEDYAAAQLAAAARIAQPFGRTVVALQPSTDTDSEGY